MGSKLLLITQHYKILSRDSVGSKNNLMDFLFDALTGEFLLITLTILAFQTK